MVAQIKFLNSSSETDAKLEAISQLAFPGIRNRFLIGITSKKLEVHAPD